MKILLVEDDCDVLANNTAFLQSAGFDTCAAATLAEARKRLEDAPDLILLDVMLPDGMGWDFAAEIRAKTSAPIVYLTCRDENESVVKGLTAGGDDYIVKPYDMQVLLSRIRSVLRRTGLDCGDVISVPPLSIDMLAGTAALAGETIPLAPREIQLLACLAKQAGRAVSSEELYRRVWGKTVPGYAHTVSVYASALRKKLRLAENGLFEIRAVSGQEYILSKTVY
ncbi:MAG: response regulator transcription factor [Oscillospiraceae bacterium]|jgi:DNA-binding response OmpR family regulator|nr:response regulator transcription factor [Oscillospiraceae bacterium]